MNNIFVTSLALLVTVILIVILVDLTIRKINNITSSIITLRTELDSIYHTLTSYRENTDKKIAEISVEINNMIDRLLKIESGATTTRAITEKVQKREIQKTNENKEKRPPLTRTQQIILEKLEEGPKTYKEIQLETGLSREHIARELKKLYEIGLLERDTKSRPYLYILKKTE